MAHFFSSWEGVKPARPTNCSIVTDSHFPRPLPLLLPLLLHPTPPSPRCPSHFSSPPLTPSRTPSPLHYLRLPLISSPLFYLSPPPSSLLHLWSASPAAISSNNVCRANKTFMMARKTRSSRRLSKKKKEEVESRRGGGRRWGDLIGALQASGSNILEKWDSRGGK